MAILTFTHKSRTIWPPSGDRPLLFVRRAEAIHHRAQGATARPLAATKPGGAISDQGSVKHRAERRSRRSKQAARGSSFSSHAPARSRCAAGAVSRLARGRSLTEGPGRSQAHQIARLTRNSEAARRQGSTDSNRCEDTKRSSKKRGSCEFVVQRRHEKQAAESRMGTLNNPSPLEGRGWERGDGSSFRGMDPHPSPLPGRERESIRGPGWNNTGRIDSSV